MIGALDANAPLSASSVGLLVRARQVMPYIGLAAAYGFVAIAILTL